MNAVDPASPAFLRVRDAQAASEVWRLAKTTPPPVNSAAAALGDLRCICILNFGSVTEYFTKFVRLISSLRRSGGLSSFLGPDGLILLLLMDGVPQWDEIWWEAEDELANLYNDHLL